MNGLRGLLGGWRRTQQALRAAATLDQVVDSQLPLMVNLPERSRRRRADYLAELVLLSEAYRHYAAGWIDRRELERRCQQTVVQLDQLRRPRHPSAAQVTELD